ncbi:uncharacterized protein LOC116120088 [Pistacia vera]|uniref:uncharacterized protein LOC116120088 n=1 Tax=Pistacia vera TaxID=55513 RepID=UPI0012632276|nr:uncharacterized protein LOC116120088 [Pistacia vera]
MEWLKNNNQLEIINLMDEDGNTILHLAAATRNRQMLELLLKCNVTNPGMLKTNAKNKRGLTVFDLVLFFPCETGYADIEMVLQYAAASSHQAETQVSVQSEHPVLDNNMSPTPRNLSPEEVLDWEEYFKFEWEGSERNRVRSDLLVVAVLMASATYQAVLSPPGGISEKNGLANLASHDAITFIWFMLSNSAGFFISLITIGILTNNYPLFWELYVAILAMAVTYDSAMISISPPGRIRLFFVCLSIVMPISIPFLSYKIRKWYKGRLGPFAYRLHRQQNA